MRREGANKGRPFWTCSKGQDEGCGFFVSQTRPVANGYRTDEVRLIKEWADGDENVAPAPRRTTSAAQVCPNVSWLVVKPNEFTSRQNRPAPPRRPPSRADDEGPQCSCGMPAVQRTVQKAGPNQGKTFHTCSKPQGEQCGFFEVGRLRTQVLEMARANLTLSSGTTLTVKPEMGEGAVVRMAVEVNQGVSLQADRRYQQVR